MFIAIFKHELKYWLKKPAFYAYLIIFFLASMVIAASLAGFFDAVSTTTGSARIANSPTRITGIFNTLMGLIFFLFPSIVGTSIYRDYKSEIHTILYSYPFSKGNYLFAKFLSSVTVVLTIVLIICIGMFIGFRLPGTNDLLVGSFDFLSYLHAYFIYGLPNVLLFSAIVFAVVSLSRSITAGYISVIVLLLVQGLMAALLYDYTNKFLSALIDPFGGAATQYYIEYWTVVELNELYLPFKGLVIYNRLFWLGIASVIFGLVYKLFSFSQEAYSLSFRKPRGERNSKRNFGGITKVKLPKVEFDFSFTQHLKTTWKLSNLDFKYIIHSWPFLCILSVGLIVSLLELSEVGNLRGTPKLPVTWRMLSYSESIIASILACTFLYAGMLIHRGTTARINQLVDSTPIPSWVLLISRLFALLKMQLVMLTMVLISGVSFQIYKGYYNFEFGLYLLDLYAINYLTYILWALLPLFVQTLIKNPYVGMFLMMGLLLLLETPLLRLAGFEQDLFLYGRGLGVWYSDMDGYGSYLSNHLIYSFYWLLAGGMLLIGAGLFLTRGLAISFKERLSIAKSRFKGLTLKAFVVLLIAFLSLGFKLYYEDNIENKRVSAKEQELNQVAWEKAYKKYQHYPQPKIVSVKTDVNIFPKELNFNAEGTYVMVNKSQSVIDSIFLSYNILPSTFRFNRPATLVSKDSIHFFNIYQLEKALQPGDSLELQFTVKNKANTWLTVHAPVRENGTFFNNKQVFPSLGYNSGKELEDDETRKKYGLAPNPLKPHPSDTTALGTNVLTRDADWIDFETIVSTSTDQIAIAPGYLQKEWIEDERRYFHYKMDIKMLHFYAFNSARYEVKREKWQGINLEIYYHKGHEYNLDRMMDGMKVAIAYGSKNFSPYQHKQARIVEFPRTGGGFAQAFPNTIPFSEAHGFIADVDDTKRGGVDYSFAVTAHEIAHQWWAHQVIGADVQGATMLSESLADYTRLKSLEQQYGKDKMRKFLKYALDDYLRDRGRETKRENPLMYNDGQSYIRYSKGAIVFYALSDYIGEEKLNGAISTYVEKVKFQEPPYTTTIELVDHIKAVTPDSLQYLIHDMLETVTLYDNKVIIVNSTQLDNGQFQVDIEFEVSKYRSDEKGKRYYESDSLIYETKEIDEPKKSLQLADYVDIGIFTEKIIDGEETEVECYFKKHKVTTIHNKLRLIVDQKPSSVGVDPYNKLIDINSEDNRKEL